MGMTIDELRQLQLKDLGCIALDYKDQAEQVYRHYLQVGKGFEAGSPQIYAMFLEFGAEMAALSKKTKRTLIEHCLIQAKIDGLDITKIVANNVAKRVINRGLDKQHLALFFSTPGRDAGDRSSVSADDLTGIESCLKVEIEKLTNEMLKTRRSLKKRYPIKSASAKQ
jgi:hypothetical protein